VPPHDDLPARPDDAGGMHLDDIAVPLLVLVAVAALWALESHPPPLWLAIALYAVRLGEQESAPHAWWGAPDLAWWAMFVVVTAFLMVANLVDDGPVWLTVMTAVVLVVELVIAIAHLVRKRSTVSTPR
jgi:hypothetical protein